MQAPVCCRGNHRPIVGAESWMRDDQLQSGRRTGGMHLPPQLRIGGHTPSDHDTTRLALASGVESLRHQDIHHRLLKTRRQISHLGSTRVAAHNAAPRF